MALGTPLKGKIVIDGSTMTTQRPRSVTLSRTGFAEDVGGIGDSGTPRTPLHKDARITIVAPYNPADAAQAKIQTEFATGDRAISSGKFYEASTKYYKGAWVITDFTITKARGQADNVNITLDINGVLTYTS